MHTPDRLLARLLVAAALAAGSIAIGHAQTTLISESFGGLGTDNLDTTVADTFSSAIASAGGSSTWHATSNKYVRANGSFAVPSTTTGSTYLHLGSYINDAKNTGTGKFTLTATLTKPSGGTWVTLGFFGESADDNSLSGLNFTNAAHTGYATALHRTSDTSGTNFIAGPESNGGSFNPGNLTGTVTFKIELDLTPAGGYNGTTNFGTVNFYDPANLNSISYTYVYTSAISVGGIGLSYSTGTAMTATVSNFSLVQQSAIPEPSACAALCGVGALGLSVWRRRRAVNPA